MSRRIRWGSCRARSRAARPLRACRTEYPSFSRLYLIRSSMSFSSSTTRTVFIDPRRSLLVILDDVEEDQVGFLPREVEGGPPVASLQDRVPFLLKVVLDQVEYVFLVVDDKNRFHRSAPITARNSRRCPEVSPSHCPGSCPPRAAPASAAGGPSTDPARLSSSGDRF